MCDPPRTAVSRTGNPNTPRAFGLSRPRCETGHPTSPSSLFWEKKIGENNIWVGTQGGSHRLTQRSLTPVESIGFVVGVEITKRNLRSGPGQRTD